MEDAAALTDNREAAQRCRNQAASMMRQTQSGTRLLQRTQSARQKALAEMQPAAMRQAGYRFRDVSVPAPEPEPVPDAEGVAPFDQLTPPDPDIVEGVVHGSTVVYRRLDQEFDLRPAG